MANAGNFLPLIIISLASILLIGAYWINHEFYTGDQICKANGYLSGGYDKKIKQYYCIDVVCPNFYEGEFGDLCKNKFLYFNSLNEIKPEGILKRDEDKTFKEGCGLCGWTVN